jgi:hypothetical protein
MSIICKICSTNQKTKGLSIICVQIPVRTAASDCINLLNNAELCLLFLPKQPYDKNRKEAAKQQAATGLPTRCAIYTRIKHR